MVYWNEYSLTYPVTICWKENKLLKCKVDMQCNVFRWGGVLFGNNI